MGNHRPFEQAELEQEDTAEELEPLPFPYVSVALLIIIVALFYAMLTVGHGDVSRAATLFGDKENDLIRAGQWWRLITPIFLHGSWGHLIANGLTLLLLGMPMERIYGARRFLLIYMVAGIVGNLFSYRFSAAPSLGASGALYGLMGAGLVFPFRFKSRIDPRARKAILSQLAVAAFINMGINFLPDLHLDKWAHLGGMIGGGFAALLWMPEVLEEEAPPRTHEVTVWVLAAAMLALICQAGWQQWQSVRRPVERAPYYVLDANDPWWGLQIPRQWRLRDTVAREGVAWTGPQHALLQITDTQDDPQLVPKTRQWIKAQAAQVSPYAVDGKSGIKALGIEGTQTVELHEIEAEGRAINIRFVCPSRAYANLQPAFETLLNSTRFVRPPQK